MAISTKRWLTVAQWSALALCGLPMMHAETPAEASSASVLLNKFETVVYEQSTLLLETRNTGIDTVDGLAELRVPFLELMEGLKVLGPDFDLHLEQNSTGFLLGAEEFSPPNGLGPVTSRRSYVIELKPNGLRTVTQDFAAAAIVTINGAQVWTWTTPPLDGASKPTTFYAKRIGGGCLLIANDQQEFLNTAGSLSRVLGNDLKSTASMTANPYRSYGFWAHRSIRRSAPAPDAIGFNDLGTDVSELTFYAGLIDRKGYVEAEVPSGDVKSISTLLPASQSGLFKSVGARTWRAIFPLSKDEKSSDTVVYVLFHLGFGANL